MNDDMINDIRKCAEVHRTVRKHITKIAKPGIKMIDMCECLEDSVRNLIEAKGIEAGIAFPTGCSLDYVAAHWTPNAGDQTVLEYNNVMKLGTLLCMFSRAASQYRFTVPKLHQSILPLKGWVCEAGGCCGFSAF